MRLNKNISEQENQKYVLISKLWLALYMHIMQMKRAIRNFVTSRYFIFQSENAQDTSSKRQRTNSAKKTKSKTKK